MQIANNPFGIFNYVITGASQESERSAAAELEERLEQIDRLRVVSGGFYSGEDILDDLARTRKEIVEKYGVEIKTTFDR